MGDRLVDRCQDLRPNIPWDEFAGEDQASVVTSNPNSYTSVDQETETSAQRFSMLRLYEDELWFLLYAMGFIEGGVNYPEETQRERMEVRIINILMNDFGYDVAELVD